MQFEVSNLLSVFVKELNNNSAINSVILTTVGPECYHQLTVAKYGQLLKEL